MLVNRGHKFIDLWQVYTMDQVWLFYEVAQKNLRQESLSMAVAMRTAFNADRQQWQRYVKALSPSLESSQSILPREKYRGLKRLLNGK